MFGNALWIELILAPIAANLLLIAVLYFFKVPKLFQTLADGLQTLTESVSSLKSAVEVLNQSCQSLQRRAEVTDRILSDIIGQPLDSEVVAKDGTKYPKIRKRRATD